VDTSEAFAPIVNLGWTILLIGAILSIAVAVVAYFIAAGIAAPVGRASRVVKMVGEGDLRENIEMIDAEDEIGVLNNAVKVTVDFLRSMVTQTLGIAERVSASSQELSSSAQEMNATTEEVSATVQQISKGTETQAQKVEETQKIMEQMAASVQQVSRSAQSTAAQAVKTSEIAQKQREAARESKEKMVAISESILNAATVVNKLGERSDQIGEIVSVITGIADQTNLLALNAAIEAARAGEYGRGFAVVAEEVRKLAEGSAKAADEITKLIKDVQKEAMQAVSDIKSVSKESTVVRDIANKAEENLADAVKGVEDVAAMIEQVSASSQEQAAGTKQVSESVTDIAAVAEETASATQEASASTEEMTASMQEMAASAQELADMGMQLRDMVARFKVGDATAVDRRPDVEGQKPAKFEKLRQRATAVKRKLEEMRTKREEKGGVKNA
jgi:methyl-accepting chemotaxis protein